jgi:hypothetical protein
MNIGQIYGFRLGGQNLVENMLLNFDGASLDQINELTDEAGITFWTYLPL